MYTGTSNTYLNLTWTCDADSVFLPYYLPTLFTNKIYTTDYNTNKFINVRCIVLRYVDHNRFLRFDCISLTAVN